MHRALGPTPRYLAAPRWGLPRVPVLREAVPAPPSALERMVAHEGTARPVLVGAATVLVLAALAELWRYVLLLQSRTELLPARTVSISDSLVITAGVLGPLIALLAMVTCTVWLIRAREAAADRLHHKENRRTFAVVLAVFVPGWNLLMPGVLMTELERELEPHRANTGPSRLLRAWWTGWVLSVVLAVGVTLWRLRDSVQADAVGVLFAALADLVAAAVVVLTMVLVQRYTEALAGARVSRRGSRRRWVASVPVRAAT